MSAGWEIRKAGDIFEMTDFVSNGSFASLRENVEYLDHPDYAVLVRLADYSNGFDSSKFVYVSKQSYEYLAKSKLFGGEIIMSNVGSVGKSFICPDLGCPMTIGPNVVLIRSKNNAFYQYYFQTEEFQQKLLSISSKATLLKFNKTNFKALDIPVPSLPEQQRIVDVLDREFAKIAALKANAEKSLQMAKDLFQATLKKALKPKKGWKVSSMGDVSSIARGGSPRPIKAFITEDADGINWIKIGDTEVGGKYISSTKEKIRKEGMRSSRFVEAGDFLLSNSMSFGRPYILKTNGCIHDGWLVIKKYEDTFTQDFLYYLLLSPSVVKQFEEGARGSTVRNLNTDIVSAVRVSYPSALQEQEEIVARVEEQNYKCKALQDNYQKTLTLCDDLKQSLLRKAFNGEL